MTNLLVDETFVLPDDPELVLDENAVFDACERTAKQNEKV